MRLLLQGLFLLTVYKCLNNEHLGVTITIQYNYNTNYDSQMCLGTVINRFKRLICKCLRALPQYL